jgi:deoxyribose-phosphate aldolase
MLRRLPHVDRVGIEERAALLGKRSIKTTAKAQGIRLAVSMVDLTTLEGQDTPGKVRNLCAKGVCPDPHAPEVPSVAAICVYPNLVPAAVARVEGTSVKVASVATAFPSGQSPIETKLEEVRWVVERGADEVDMVIDRGAFLSGRYAKVYDEIVRVKEACGETHLKVILETGELGTYDNVRRASLLAIAAGADFIKTSTGKVPSSATLPVALVMLEAIRDVYDETGRRVGFKPAGGISTAKDAMTFEFLMKEELGNEWLQPGLFRIGASTLVADIERQLEYFLTGRYASFDHHAMA